MTADIVSLVFIVGAVVLLALLWRRGPERRGAFFVAGLLVVGASVVLALSEDALEQGLDDAYREWRADRAVKPSDAPSMGLIEPTSVATRGIVRARTGAATSHGIRINPGVARGGTEVRNGRGDPRGHEC